MISQDPNQKHIEEHQNVLSNLEKMLDFPGLGPNECEMVRENIIQVTNLLNSLQKDNKENYIKSFIDPLTGLGNKNYLEKRTKELAVQYQGRNDNVTALVMDAGAFKSINDKYGHNFGDETIKKIGELIQENFRKEDILVRFGGDEFHVYMPNTSYEQAQVPINNLLKKAKKGFKIPYDNGNTVQDIYIQPHLDIGIACYDNPEQDIKILSEKADAASYVAKRKFKLGYVNQPTPVLYTKNTEKENEKLKFELEKLNNPIEKTNPMKTLKTLYSAITSKLTNYKPIYSTQ